MVTTTLGQSASPTYPLWKVAVETLHEYCRVRKSPEPMLRSMTKPWPLMPSANF